MMNTGNHKEDAIKAAIKKTLLHNPSPDFSARVMQKIKVSEKSTTYTPLISRKGWALVAVAAVFVILGAFYLKTASPVSLLKDIELTKITRYLTLPDLSGAITLSGNMAYGLGFAAVIILLQIPILKTFHQQRLWKNNR